ncbi:MAG: PRC-barrel domain-containing protein [Burkholderiaceae bacterium]
MHSIPSLAAPSQPVTQPGASTGPPAIELSSALLHLLGEAVVDREGQGVGTIDDLLVDRKSGCIAYAVMVRGVFSGGEAERQLVLPWSALHFDAAQRRYLLDVDAAHLSNAPCLCRERSPQAHSAEWHLSVHCYYGAVPYWR